MNMAEETQPSVEAEWDAYTSGAETETETTEPVETNDAGVDTEASSTDEPIADPIPDNDDDLLGPATTDFDSIRQEMAALKQQLEQERLSNQELIRRAQQSFRDQGASLLERVEQRLEPVQQTLADLVKQGLLTPEDAQSRLNVAERQYRREEISRDQQQRNAALHQQWLATQQGSMSAQQQATANPDVITVQQKIEGLMSHYRVTVQDLRAAGAPDDISHLSPVQALDTASKWVVAAARLKQAQGGNPARAGGKQLPYPDMGGGAGVAAQSAESISAELNKEMGKPNPNFERIAELDAALTKYIQ
jgi:hypothetical protein